MSFFTEDNRAEFTLRVAVALTCVATSAALLMYGGPVLSMLWLNLDWSEQAALRVENAAAFVLIACTPLLFWRKALAAPVLVGAWLLLTMIAQTAIATWHPWLTPGALAARWLAPFAILALTLKYTKTGEWLLRAGIATTFACHGIEALLGHPQFIDYLITGGDKLAGLRVEESTAVTTLLLIGVMDVCVALAILIPKRLRPLAAWMAFWGFMTAASRIVYMGWANWPEALIRVTNGAVPLTLLLVWTSKTQGNDAAE